MKKKKFKVRNLKKIDRKMNLGELVQTYPEAGRLLVEDYGLHCVGCFASSFDTLEQGAKIHGYDDREIEEMIKKLEKIAERK